MSAIPLFPETATETIRNELEETLQLQRAAYFAHPFPSFAERKADLLKLQAMMRDHREAILDAISADYGNRSRHETLFAEIFGVMDGVDHTLKHLKLWMKPQKRGVDWRNFFGASNRVIPQPVGIVGHIVPWNFPIFLCFGGLTSAFAAGNRCMVKMSENSRHLARLLIDKAPAYFPKEKLAFFDETGGVGMEFSKLKFDHILFTGSGQTGRAVMAAASQNLCPVTLELGGKAPALICDDFPLDKATERITFFKYFNAGQICTTADHVFVPQHKVDEFVEIARKAVSRPLSQPGESGFHLGHRRARLQPHHRRPGRGAGAGRHAGATRRRPEMGRSHAQDRAAHRSQCAARLRAAHPRDLRAGAASHSLHLGR